MPTSGVTALFPPRPQCPMAKKKKVFKNSNVSRMHENTLFKTDSKLPVDSGSLGLWQDLEYGFLRIIIPQPNYNID